MSHEQTQLPQTANEEGSTSPKHRPPAIELPSPFLPTQHHHTIAPINQQYQDEVKVGFDAATMKMYSDAGMLPSQLPSQAYYPTPVAMSPNGWYSVPFFHLPSGLLTPGTPAAPVPLVFLNPQFYNEQQHNHHKNFTLKHLQPQSINNPSSSSTSSSTAPTATKHNTFSATDNSNKSQKTTEDCNINKERVNEAIASKRNVYIRGLGPETTDESLKELASKFGAVESSKAILEQIPIKDDEGNCRTEYGPCKGYGFVMFSHSDSAAKAVFELNKLGYDASIAKDSFSERLKSLQDGNSTNVYVSNMPETILEDELEELCNKYGVAVVSHRVLRDESGKSRGVGFVRVETREMAQSLISKLNGLVIGSDGPMRARYADNNAQKKLKTNTGKKKKDLGLGQPQNIVLMPFGAAVPQPTAQMMPVYGFFPPMDIPQPSTQPQKEKK